MTSKQIKQTLDSFYYTKDKKIDSIVYAEIVSHEEEKYCTNIITNILYKENGDVVFETKNIIGLIVMNPMSLEEIKSELDKLECKIFYILDDKLELHLVELVTTVSSYEVLDDNITEVEYKTLVFMA